MLHLDPLNKVLVMAGAAAAVAVTILLVVCFVGEGCLVYEVVTHSKKKKEQARRLSGALCGAQDKIGVNLTKYSSCDTRHIPTRQQSVTSAHSLNEKTDHSILSRLSSSRSRTDSTYSSMSSGRTSPSSSCPPEEVSRKSKLSLSPPALSFSLLASISPDSSLAKLVIAVESATDLPGRDYGAHCDPWVSVTVLKDRRSLRRRPPLPLAFFRTKTIRHAHNPFYSQTFVTDIERKEMKDISLLFTVMDQDRHCGAVEMGHTTITLKEAEQLVEDPVKFSTSQIIKQRKKDCGEILFGLSYLPTAQRLSFSLIKLTNIKVEVEEESLNPYLKIMMFTQSGRLVKKKKTTVKIATKDPVFNETINFEVSPGQLEDSRFLIILCNRRQVVDMVNMEEGMERTNQEHSDQELESERYGRRESQSRLKDVYLGRIALGKNVFDSKAREHYRSVCCTPRQVFSMWHTVR